MSWIVETYLAGRVFPELAYGVGKDGGPSGNNWLVCKIENDKFVAYGGPEKLEEMIRVFLAWAVKAA